MSDNDFRNRLDDADIGVTSYTLGASLGVDVAGTLTYYYYYYYGKEAGCRNDFWAGGLSHSSGFSPTNQSLFGNPYEIGSLNVGPGLLDFVSARTAHRPRWSAASAMARTTAVVSIRSSRSPTRSSGTPCGCSGTTPAPVRTTITTTC
jgi:hypothetical protein